MSVKKSKNRRLRDMAAAEREHMLPLNYAVAYILTPLYVVLAIVMLIAIGGLNASGKTQSGLICLGALALVTAAFLLSFPYSRRKAIKSELERYDLDNMKKESERLGSRDRYEFSEEELSVKFDRYGMTVRDELHYYNHMKKLVMTGNDYKRVGIYICFYESEDSNILLPLNPKILRMLEDFDVVLDNQAVLDYIFAHPQDAFSEIYDRGTVTVSV